MFGLALAVGCGEAAPFEEGAGGTDWVPECGGPEDCDDDGDPCTVNVCDRRQGRCLSTAVPDGVACTLEDGTDPGQCVSGVCVGLCHEVDCDDGDPCTDDVCDLADGSCTHPFAADGTECLFQGDPGQCSTGVCVGLCDGVDCDDREECTEDMCSPADGTCSNVERPDGAVCSFGGLPGVCRSGRCVDAARCRDVDCRDGNDCTDDVCNPQNGACSHPDKVDGAICHLDGYPGRCTTGVCIGLCEGAACRDGNPCTSDACDPSTGACRHPPVKDGTWCEVREDPGRCRDGVCLGLCAGVDCDDGNECTADRCTRQNGKCTHTRVPDGAPCTGGECRAGQCGLLFACTEAGIRAAIAEGGGPHYFDCDGPTTVVTEAEIVIDEDVILDGEGKLAIGRGGPPYGFSAHRVLSVVSDVTAELRAMTVKDSWTWEAAGAGIANDGNLTLTNCSVSNNGSHQPGGGIYNRGWLKLTNSSVVNNSAGFVDDGGGRGAGIANAGVLVLVDSAVSENHATGAGAGIHNSGVATLTRSKVSDNEVGNGTGGAGIFNDSEATLTLNASIVSGNRGVRDTGASGGGIFNRGNAALVDSIVSENETRDYSGSYPSITQLSSRRSLGGGIANWGLLSVTGCTVSRNAAAGLSAAGGGIYNGGKSAVTRSTVSANTAAGDYDSAGAALYNDGSLTVTNTTVSGNRAIVVDMEDSFESTGGGIANSGELSLVNTTLSNNEAGAGSGVWNLGEDPSVRSRANIVEGPCGTAESVRGTWIWTSNGHNIESPGDTCGFDRATDQVDVGADDLGLGPLENGGGPTMTHALLPGSVAIDQIPARECLDEDGQRLTTDQRSEPRPEEGGTMCDVGAFEAGSEICDGLAADLSMSAPRRWASSPRQTAAWETLTFTAYARATNRDSIVAIGDVPATSFDDNAALVRFNKQGYFDVGTVNPRYLGDQGVPYTLEQWYKITAEIDVEAQTYTAKVGICNGEQRAIHSKPVVFRSAPDGGLEYYNLWSDSGRQDIAAVRWTPKGTNRLSPKLLWPIDCVPEVWGTGFDEVADPWAGSCGPNFGDSLWAFDPPWAPLLSPTQRN